MEIRKYRDFESPKHVAGLIAFEVVNTGKSEGWQGSTLELNEVRDILNPFGITYQDDFKGIWRHKTCVL